MADLSQAARFETRRYVKSNGSDGFVDVPSLIRTLRAVNFSCAADSPFLNLPAPGRVSGRITKSLTVPGMNVVSDRDDEDNLEDA